MRTIRDLADTLINERILIVGAGSSVKKYKDEIHNYGWRTVAQTIGVNNMTEFHKPHFHLWTNTQRFRTFGSGMDRLSKVLLGCNIPRKVINDIIGDKEYFLINYEDKEGRRVGYKSGKILGFYRTAGCLAIMIAHIMGASTIEVVGMDGYTYHPFDKLIDGESQHCYGQGMTDTADWETCVLKDGKILKALRGIRDFGVDFKIITPTIYEEFYDGTVLS
jgi:hypothetical protein